MAEEGFVRMYVRDFAALAARAEAGVEVEALLQRRMAELRSHAVLMDQRKAGDHLGAVAERLREEALRRAVRSVRESDDPEGVVSRRGAFLLRAADLLDAAPVPAETADVRAAS